MSYTHGNADDPSAVAIMLTCRRDESAYQRAIAAFRHQTYPAARLLVWDTSPGAVLGERTECDRVIYRGAEPQLTVGELRNAACREAVRMGAEIIVHMDDDDVSHPARIAEQVEALQAATPGVWCVGYREVVFWDTRRMQRDGSGAEAWIYTHPHPAYIIGASMCYWAAFWKIHPFEDAPHEDQRWWMQNAARCRGFSSVVDRAARLTEPRLLCTIHGRNTEAYHPGEMAAAREWVRDENWDDYCKEKIGPWLIP